MSLYLPAFLGQHDGREIPGHYWTGEAGSSLRQIVDNLRHENPWLAARSIGREIFTLDIPDDPEGEHLRQGRAGGWKPEFRHSHSRDLLRLLLLRSLRDRRFLVDLRTGFVSLESQELPDGRLAVEGLELHLLPHATQEFQLWLHPVRRILDPRPQALSDARQRAIDVWFPLEGVSYTSVLARKAALGHTITIGRRSRLVRETDAAALLLSEEPADLSAQTLVKAVRNWFPAGSLEDLGVRIAKDPMEADNWTIAPLQELTVGLDHKNNPIDPPDLFHAALGGYTAIRIPRLPPITYHLEGVDEKAATRIAQILNRRAQDWGGVALQFSIEPVQGSRALPLDPRSILVTQPNSPRAAGFVASMFLELVRRSGGSPWRLEIPEGRPVLGISQALLYGKMNHISLALLDATGHPLSGLVSPYRYSDLNDAPFAHSLVRKLIGELPEDLVIHVDENGDLPTAFLQALAPGRDVWKVRRKSVARVIAAQSFDWLPPGQVALGPDHALASLFAFEDRRFLSLERLQGKGDALAAMELAVGLELAWVPGRAERRHGPASLEWARGLLFQKDRFAGLI